MTTLAHDSALRGPATAASPPAARSSAGPGACSAASGASRSWCVALLTVAVAAAIVSIILVYNTSPAVDGEFGSASGLLMFDGSDPQSARSSPGIGRGVVRDDGSHRPPQGSRARRRRDGGLPRAGPGWALRRRSPRAPSWQLPGRARPGRPHRGCGRAPQRGARGDAGDLDGRRRTVVGIVENPRRSQ